MNSRELQRMVSTGRYIELIAWSVLPRNVNPLTGFRTLEEYSYLGSFGFVHRAVFEDVGGFDEAFAGWGFEDLNLMLRLSLTGDKWKFLGRSGKPLFHIAHKRPVGWELDKQRNRDLYLQREKDLGVTLRVNHIFKVYEGDGRSVLQTREDRQKDVELPHFW